MIIEYLKCLPEDIEIDLLFDIDRAIEASIATPMAPYIDINEVMAAWFDLIIAQAISADSIALSDMAIESYMASIPVSMEETLTDICELSGFCLLMDNGVFFNSPQMSLFSYRVDINFTELSHGGVIWE